MKTSRFYTLLIGTILLILGCSDQGEIYHNTEREILSCEPGYILDGEECINAEKYYNRLCAKEEKIWNGKKCVCTEDKIEKDGKCVPPPPPGVPSCQIIVIPNSAQVGGQVTLNFSSENATQAKLNGENTALSFSKTFLLDKVGEVEVMGEVFGNGKKGNCSTRYNVTSLAPPLCLAPREMMNGACQCKIGFTYREQTNQCVQENSRNVIYQFKSSSENTSKNDPVHIILVLDNSRSMTAAWGRMKTSLQQMAAQLDARKIAYFIHPVVMDEIMPLINSNLSRYPYTLFFGDNMREQGYVSHSNPGIASLLSQSMPKQLMTFYRKEIGTEGFSSQNRSIYSLYDWDQELKVKTGLSKIKLNDFFDQERGLLSGFDYFSYLYFKKGFLPKGQVHFIFMSDEDNTHDNYGLLSLNNYIWEGNLTTQTRGTPALFALVAPDQCFLDEARISFAQSGGRFFSERAYWCKHPGALEGYLEGHSEENFLYCPQVYLQSSCTQNLDGYPITAIVDTISIANGFTTGLSCTPKVDGPVGAMKQRTLDSSFMIGGRASCSPVVCKPYQHNPYVISRQNNNRIAGIIKNSCPAGYSLDPKETHIAGYSAEYPPLVASFPHGITARESRPSTPSSIEKYNFALQIGINLTGNELVQAFKQYNSTTDVQITKIPSTSAPTPQFFPNTTKGFSDAMNAMFPQLQWKAHAVVSTDGKACPGETPGQRSIGKDYIDLATAHQGHVEEICHSDYSELVEKLKHEIILSKAILKYPLPSYSSRQIKSVVRMKDMFQLIASRDYIIENGNILVFLIDPGTAEDYQVTFE